MKVLRSQQFLPISLSHAWDFFSSPKNLNEITPEDMVFKITSVLPEKMYQGMFITYKIAPVMNVPLDWVTEITQIEVNKYFVDEQRKGPYNIWHHEHHFQETQGGVLMTDILHYDIGMGVLGWIAGKLYVDAKVKGIFEYREKKLKELFLA
ncbi:MAG: SRPBCC family protein [Pseudarcicella sp.]|jgi:ligand-binding SRPBCC domain-containing protein|nr:SRPBCC family protein [Pseudarcicella sp.]MBP6411188.1 SRPBCC family protein [Pseudarcicella sp.]